MSDVRLNDTVAAQQFELVIGSDRILRINIDGVCLLRVSVAQHAAIDIRNDLPQGREVRYMRVHSEWGPESGIP